MSSLQKGTRILVRLAAAVFVFNMLFGTVLLNAAERQNTKTSAWLDTAPPPPRESSTSQRERGGLPMNLHTNFSIDLSTIASLSASDIVQLVPPSTFAQFEMVYGYTPGKLNGVGHRGYRGPMMNGVLLLAKLQLYSYASLNRFWELSKQHNIRFSAHGGTLMGSYCHSSINPWDDDIDVTASNCSVLDGVYYKLRPATEAFPNMKVNQHTAAGWEGRALDDSWILIKGPRSHPWYKLKSVAQIRDIPNRDLAGMDIMCFSSGISRPEQNPMKISGYQEYLTGDQPLLILPFGPMNIMRVRDDVLKNYVQKRYGKAEFCDFPLGKMQFEMFPQTLIPPLPVRASEMVQALTKFYISQYLRDSWLEQVGNGRGNELTQEIPSLDDVEIDNSIAPLQSCQMTGEAQERLIKVIDWNAARGTYWAEFAEIIEENEHLQKPDIVILNEMDMGMARSSNMHTTRKLAFRLGMNYAWGLEFVELTNGDEKEQNLTQGMKNTMGLHGNAILSSCPIYDPMVVRDQLDERYFSNKKFKGNAMGHEKRLGGRMGMFVRTGKVDASDTVENLSQLLQQEKHIIIGSVHKVQPVTQQEKIWTYFGFGPFPNATADGSPFPGVAPSNVLGIIVAGDLESRSFCRHAGIKNLDRPQKHPTFPADCSTRRMGHWRGDQFCGNMKVYSEDRTFLPCYHQAKDNVSNSTSFQLSDHAIIQIMLKIN